MDKMDFSEFKNWALDSVKNFLPEEYRDAQVELYPVVKAGIRYTGLIVHRESEHGSPIVDLEDAYHHYLLDMPLKAVGERMAEIVLSRRMEFDLDVLGNYEALRKKLFIRVCNAETNRELLERVPHKRIKDLAVTYHVLLNDGEENISSAMIDNAVLNAFAIGKAQLHEDALKSTNTVMPAEIYTMPAMLEHLGMPCGMEVPEESAKMIVVTNKNGIDGASALFYPGVAEEVAKAIGGSYYILPSSIHEVIAVPCDLTRSVKDLEQMVYQINRLQVAPEARLSDHIYRYDSRSRVFDQAKAVNREKEKERE